MVAFRRQHEVSLLEDVWPIWARRSSGSMPDGTGPLVDHPPNR
jgi:hypothetical protein